MDIGGAIGLVALAVGAAILLRIAGNAIADLRRHWSLRHLRFCPQCGVVLGERGTCLHCGYEEPKPAAAGKEPSSPN